LLRALCSYKDSAGQEGNACRDDAAVLCGDVHGSLHTDCSVGFIPSNVVFMDWFPFEMHSPAVSGRQRAQNLLKLLIQVRVDKTYEMEDQAMTDPRHDHDPGYSPNDPRYVPNRNLPGNLTGDEMGNSVGWILAVAVAVVVLGAIIFAMSDRTDTASN